ncbi:hypothetical protein BH11PSE5_BH11PSE5_06390 [soil metagenome]
MKYMIAMQLVSPILGSANYERLTIAVQKFKIMHILKMLSRF